MTAYSVTWTIDVDADTPIEAAYQAWVIQHDPVSTATVFQVAPVSSIGEGGRGEEVTIDLIEAIKVGRDRRDH